MTPLQINTSARQRYNAINDTFFPDPLIYDLIYQAELELANEAFLIENIYTTTSVVNQQDYSYPNNAIALKRVVYNGKKLHPINRRQDDTLTVVNQIVLATGAPAYYSMWNNIISLRAIPDTSGLTIEIWAYIQPQQVTALSVLEVPTQYHMQIVNFVVSEMCAMNKNYDGAQYYRALWEKDVMRAKRQARKKTITDGFDFVGNVDIYPQSILGTV